MKTVSLSFGKALSYRPPHPDRTLCVSIGHGMKFCEFPTAEKAEAARLRDGQRHPARQIGYRPLHPRYLNPAQATLAQG